MHQLIDKKNKIIIYLLFLLILSTTSGEFLKSNNNYSSKVNQINIEGLSKKDTQKILNELNKIFYKNILLVSKEEIQIAVMGNKTLGAIELKPRRKFYDYEAKYNLNAKTKHIIPVNLTKKKYDELMQISLNVHNMIGCRGVTRSDFKYYKNKFYLLEINTQPGMTKLSLVPEISAYNGINFINLIKLILKDASTNK